MGVRGRKAGKGKAGDLSSYLVWFDTEYTSLDLGRARLLQVAMVITDGDLRRIGPPERDVRLAIRLPPSARLSPWVEENLKPLVARCRSAGAVTAAEADRRLAAALDDALGPAPAAVAKRPVLAGNSVHADWWLARRFLPQFLGRLHYRQLDVTALKLEWLRRNPSFDFEKESGEIVRRYFPGALIGPDERHDAYYDAQASAAELAFYRKHLLSRPARAARGAAAKKGSKA
jgi:oligoribonuclease